MTCRKRDILYGQYTRKRKEKKHTGYIDKHRRERNMKHMQISTIDPLYQLWIKDARICE